MSALRAFVAGLMATLLAHQPALWILQLAGLTERGPFALDPTSPLGVPAVVSLAFWGGLWGIPLWMIVRKRRGAGYWLTAALFGAIAPTLVAAFVAAPLKGQAIPTGWSVAVTGLVVNAAWGLGTAAFLVLFARGASSRSATAPPGSP
ncbi:MAG TPA: hypothetical protein VMS56_04290 [Thermoanaerobaculia bacterium]|nr:hypothetical protein [Thermoanaerobaculia bacterium]